MQSKTSSLIEALLNTTSGFIISWLLWMLIVAPLFGYKQSPGEAFHITMIFTMVSIVRSYLWRRYFNKLVVRQLGKL